MAEKSDGMTPENEAAVKSLDKKLGNMFKTVTDTLVDGVDDELSSGNKKSNNKTLKNKSASDIESFAELIAWVITD